MEQTGEASTCEGGRKSFLDDHSQPDSIAEPVTGSWSQCQLSWGPTSLAVLYKTYICQMWPYPQSGGDLYSLQVLQMGKVLA